MLNWLKRTLGIAPASTPLVLENPVVETTAAKSKKTAPKKKATTKKATKKSAPKKKAVDLSTMKKDELLVHAKKSGANVNASMKKADIITAINAA